MIESTLRCRFPVSKKRAAVGEAKVPRRVTRMLALAHHIERLVETGELTGYAEAAQTLGLTRARLTQITKLLQLAPEVQEQILLGTLTWTERRLRQVVREATWRQQLAVLRTNACTTSRTLWP